MNNAIVPCVPVHGSRERPCCQRNERQGNSKELPWNLHMESPKDHSTVIKAADINGIQNTAIRMSIRAFVKVRRRRIRYTTPQPMLELQSECFGLQPLSKGFPKQIATQDRIPF